MGYGVGGELQKRYVALMDRRKELERELENVKEDMTRIEGPIIDQMLENGMQRVTLDGRTLSIRTERWPKFRPGMGQEQLQVALRECGLSYLIKETVNSNSLRSAMIEAQDNGGIPEALSAVSELTEQRKLSATKA
jgi:hypothetical protein